MTNHPTLRGLFGAGAVFGGLVLVLTALAALAGSGSAAAGPTEEPANTRAPSISGEAREGRTLRGQIGEWSGTQPMAFFAQWRRCNSQGANCTTVATEDDVKEPAYTLTAADVGRRMRLTIVASNRDGRSSATSRATDVVRAAPAQRPRNVSPPTISGTAQEGQTLTGNQGRWEGTEPIDYNFHWQRCDRNGNSCADIAGATSTAYLLTSADVGNRVRLRLQANNRGGRTNAHSAPSAVVAAKGPSLPPGAVRLPDGKYSIPVTSVGPPQRLLIGQLDFSPNPLRSRDALITARFRISDTRGYIVRGALVFVTPLPYGWTTQPPEVISGTDGWATVTMQATARLPRRGAIVMFVRARKGGDFVLTGISSRRLVQMLVSLQ